MVCGDVIGGVFPSLPVEFRNIRGYLDRDRWPSRMMPNGVVREFGQIGKLEGCQKWQLRRRERVLGVLIIGIMVSI